MATSSDKDPAPEKDAPASGEGADAPGDRKEPRSKSKAGAVATKPVAPPPPDDDDDDDDDEDDDDEDDEEAAEEPPPKPAAKKAAPAKASSKPAKGKPTSKSKLVTPRAVPPQAQGGALGKSLVLFVIVVGGLALGFGLLGREGGGDSTPAPKWKDGQTVDAEVTLVPSDNKDLACASADEVAGRHCQYEAQAKPWSKGGDGDDKLLKPYTTTDRVQFLAAGLWDQPALKAGKLPNTRFSVKCKYKVEGKMKKPFIRWSADGQWFDRADDWYVGSMSDCQLVGP